MTVLTGRKIQLHSQTLSNYRLTRRLLPAPFGAWAGMTLIIQPGLSELLRKSHIDARPSVGARSTWMMNSQESRSQAILSPVTVQCAKLITFTDKRHHLRSVANELFL